MTIKHFPNLGEIWQQRINFVLLMLTGVVSFCMILFVVITFLFVVLNF